MSSKTLHRYEFGPFCLDKVERVLTFNGSPVSLMPKAFEVLLALVENSRHVVSKDELMTAVWPEAHVEEANLTQNIFLLRRVLGEGDGGRQYIETIPRRGYRFIADVREVKDEVVSPPRSARAEANAAGRGPRANVAANSIAVLPLINGSHDPNFEYLFDGITESIINNLSQLPSLKVMARSTVFRYKGREVDVLEVGRELGVRAVLTGRVIGLNDRLTISVELVDVDDGSQCWGRRYHVPVSNVFAAQDEIVNEITHNLQIKVTAEEKERLARRYTENVGAHHCYLKGRYFWNKYSMECVERAIGYFRQAVTLDPTYALAYAGLADSYQRLSSSFLPPEEALPMARSLALKAIECDDTLPEAHSSLGVITTYWNLDFHAAESEHLRAIELNAGSSLIRQRYGMCLLYMERFEEARAELTKAFDLDPLSPQINVNLGLCFIFTGKYDLAFQQMSKAVELDPNYYPARVGLGYAYMHTGNLTKAIAELKRAWRLGKDFHSLGLMGCAYALFGKRREAERVVAELREASKRRYISPYHLATVYACIGEKEAALEWLERLYADKNDYLTFLKLSPELKSMHTEPEFVDLLKRTGLLP
jgi:TolB-like protein/Tfp pilus assembly protein PilF